jgi:hypothetical protein
MSKLTRSHLAILDLAVEDWYGLWEVVGHIPDNEPRRPSSPSSPPPTLDELIDALRDLLARGFVELGIRDSPSAPGSAVSDPSTWPDLTRHETWAVPAGAEPAHVFTATDAGAEAYRAGYAKA